MPYEVFKLENVYITLGVANNPLRGRTCRALDREDLVKDPRFDTAANRVTHRRVLVPLLNEILGARPVDEWLARLDKAGVPAGRISRWPRCARARISKARGMMVSLPHPKAGIDHGDGRGTAARGRAAPLLGQHTDEILTGLLLLGQAKVDRLRADGVV